MHIKYRLLEDSQRRDFAEMVKLLYLEDPEGLPITDEKIDRTILESIHHPDKLKLFVFDLENKAIGYAILCFYWSNEYGGDIIHIDEMYIKESYRGLGIAAGFFRNIVESDSQAVALELETTPSNKKAFQYYKKLGFSEAANSHLILNLKEKNTPAAPFF